MNQNLLETLGALGWGATIALVSAAGLGIGVWVERRRRARERELAELRELVRRLALPGSGSEEPRAASPSPEQEERCRRRLRAVLGR